MRQEEAACQLNEQRTVTADSPIRTENIDRTESREHFPDACQRRSLENVRMNAVPVIRNDDADIGHSHDPQLIHDHDSQDLQLKYAEKTLSYLSQLWNGEFVLEASLDGKRYLLAHGKDGFSAKPVH